MKLELVWKQSILFEPVSWMTTAPIIFSSGKLVDFTVFIIEILKCLWASDFELRYLVIRKCLFVISKNKNRDGVKIGCYYVKFQI